MSNPSRLTARLSSVLCSLLLVACSVQEAQPVVTPTTIQAPPATTIQTSAPAAATTSPLTPSNPAATSVATSVPPVASLSCPAPISAIAINDAPTDLATAGATLAGDLGRFNQYDMQITLDRAAAIVSGTQTLAFTNRTGEPLSDLVFHLYPNLPAFAGELAISCALVDSTIVAPQLEDGGWIMRLPLPQTLAAGASTKITLAYTTQVPRDASETAYGSFNLEDDLWALASFYPILALHLENGWDVLRPNGWGDFVNSEMAIYRVAVTTNPADGILMGTGVQKGTCAQPGCTVLIGSGPQRDFALAQAIGWEQLRAQTGETTVVSSFPPNQAVAGQRALELTIDAIKEFSDNFGPYPYTEFDILPLPARNFAGIEYPGMTMITEAYYERTDDPRLDLQDVVVHEVAHQWWYNVVGNDVLREAWLDEGLTSYSSEYLYTQWKGQDLKGVTANRQRSLTQQGIETVPIDLGVTEYSTGRAYVGIIYGRAPLFFDALRTEIGDEAFFKLLREHYAQNSFGTATTTGFQALAEAAAGRSLDSFFAAWFQS